MHLCPPGPFCGARDRGPKTNQAAGRKWAGIPGLSGRIAGRAWLSTATTPRGTKAVGPREARAALLTAGPQVRREQARESPPAPPEYGSRGSNSQASFGVASATVAAGQEGRQQGRGLAGRWSLRGTEGARPVVQATGSSSQRFHTNHKAGDQTRWGHAGRQDRMMRAEARTRSGRRGGWPHLVDVHGRDGSGGHCRVAGGVGQ